MSTEKPPQKCKCGHSKGVHWHTNILGSCGAALCDCKMFDPPKAEQKNK